MHPLSQNINPETTRLKSFASILSFDHKAEQLLGESLTIYDILKHFNMLSLNINQHLSYSPW